MGRGAFGFGRYIDRVIHMQIKPENQRIGLIGGGNRYFYRAPAIRQGRFYKIKIKDIEGRAQGPVQCMGQLDGAIAGQITEAFKGEQIEVGDSGDPISGPVPGQFNQLAMDGGARRQHAAR